MYEETIGGADTSYLVLGGTLSSSVDRSVVDQGLACHTALQHCLNVEFFKTWCSPNELMYCERFLHEVIVGEAELANVRKDEGLNFWMNL